MPPVAHEGVLPKQPPDPGELGHCRILHCTPGLHQDFYTPRGRTRWPRGVVFVPLFEIFAPFGDRVTLETGKGTVVLRDLSGADEFVGLVLARPRRPER